MIFRHIANFSYKEENYQLYLAEKSRKYAFLKGNYEDGLTYPSLEELVELAYAFSEKENVYNIKTDIKKRLNFLPKVKYQGALLLLTASLLTGCGAAVNTTPAATKNNQSSTTSVSSSSNTSTSTESSTPKLKVTKVIDFEKLLAPADDEYDYKYASDYEYHKMTKLTRFRDASAIKDTLGLPDVTIDEIKKVLDQNKDISPKYKQFIIDYVNDWDALYPGSNHDILYVNLKTLQIHEVSQKEISKKTYSTDSRACYLRSENAIYVLDDIDISKESDGYIELTHELTHAARMFDITDDKAEWTYVASFKEDYALGTYAEEALITNFAYEMQGLNQKSHYYTLLCSYFRILLEAIDYNGADYTNHSVNHLIDRMNEYTGTDEGAYIIAQLEAQSTIRFTPYMEVAYDEFSDLYTYLVKIYMSKHLNADMTYEEALEVFNDFYDEINYHFQDIYSAYGITEESFMPGFNEALDNLGISHEQGLGR